MTQAVLILPDRDTLTGGATTTKETAPVSSPVTTPTPTPTPTPPPPPPPPPPNYKKRRVSQAWKRWLEQPLDARAACSNEMETRLKTTRPELRLPWPWPARGWPKHLHRC